MIQFPEVPRRRGKPMDMRSLNRTLDWRKGLVEDYKALSHASLSNHCTRL